MLQLPDLQAICSALEHFSLPAALCSIEENSFVVWNNSFRKKTGLPEAELARKSLNSIILFDKYESGLVIENPNSKFTVQFVACVLKQSLLGEWVPGRALRRSDGMLLVMLNLPLGDVAFEGFVHGRLIGREEERKNTIKFLHDIFSSKLLVASFLAQEILQNSSASRTTNVTALAKMSKLLHEIIDDFSHYYEEKPLCAVGPFRNDAPS